TILPAATILSSLPPPDRAGTVFITVGKFHPVNFYQQEQVRHQQWPENKAHKAKHRHAYDDTYCGNDGMNVAQLIQNGEAQNIINPACDDKRIYSQPYRVSCLPLDSKVNAQGNPDDSTTQDRDY